MVSREARPPPKTEVTPLICPIEGQNNKSNGGVRPSKKRGKIPIRKGGRGVWGDWDGFPYNTGFEF